MIRRRRTIADRLAALESADRADRWTFTLDDGRTATLPVGAVLDALAEAFDRLGDGDQDEAATATEDVEPSRALRLLARVADDSEPSMLGSLAVQLARAAVAQHDARGTT
ncbi:hypothetical protein AB0I84_45385 [Streptomyces spectabilis]|uniref:hypothetical protein n=1 Tax=Streptomyces spectabilis TaxID=68270 RepID=UPI0033D20957